MGHCVYYIIHIGNHSTYVKQLALTQPAVIQVPPHHECQTSQFPDEGLLAVVPRESGKSGDKQCAEKPPHGCSKLLPLQPPTLQKKHSFVARSKNAQNEIL